MLFRVSRAKHDQLKVQASELLLQGLLHRRGEYCFFFFLLIFCFFFSRAIRRSRKPFFFFFFFFLAFSCGKSDQAAEAPEECGQIESLFSASNSSSSSNNLAFAHTLAPTCFARRQLGTDVRYKCSHCACLRRLSFNRRDAGLQQRSSIWCGQLNRHADTFASPCNSSSFHLSPPLSPLQLLQPTTSRSLHNPTFAVCSIDQSSVGVADRALYDNRSQQASQPLVDATQAHILSLSTRCLSPGRYQLQPL